MTARFPVTAIVRLLPALVLLVLLVYHGLLGPELSRDSHTFDRLSDRVLSWEFSLTAYWQGMAGPERLYLVSLFGVAFLKLASGEAWPMAWLAGNLALVALTMAAFVAAGRRLGLGMPVIASASLLFLLSADYLTWPRFLLTDTGLAFLVMLAVMVATKPLGRLTGVLQSAVLVTMAFTRPAAIPAVIAFAAFYGLTASGADQASRHVVALGLIGGTVAASGIYAAVMWTHYNQWLPPTRALDYLGSYAHQGAVILHRDETAITMHHGVVDYLRLFYARLFSFYFPWVEGFSLRHRLFNGVLHGAIALAAVRLYLRPPVLSQPQRRAILLIVLLAAAVAVFHTVTLIDYDFRYRYPVVAPLLLMVAIALSSLRSPSRGARTHARS